MFDKIKSFVQEKIKWHEAGNTYRTEERIQELYEICSSNTCGNFIQAKTHGSCGICGCRLSKKKELLNKLAWTTTKCPMEEPLWVEETNPNNIDIKQENQDIQI